MCFHFRTFASLVGIPTGIAISTIRLKSLDQELKSQ